MGCEFQVQVAIQEHLNLLYWLEFLVKVLLWEFHHKRGDWQGGMLAFLTLSSNIAHLHHHPSCQVSIGKIVLEQARDVWEPSQPADAILDKASLALAKGMLVYISKDRMKEHQKVSGVKTSLQQEILCPLESSTNTCIMGIGW